MTLSVRQTQARQMAEVREALARPQFVHVVASVLVHEPADAGAKPCPCCGSTFARIARTVPDGEVLIDRATGRRVLPAHVKPDTWARAVEIAERHEVKFRVSEAQLPLLLDDSDRHTLVAGSHRSGKTTLALLWIVRQWLRRGGRLRRFWFVGETLDKAHELVRTIFEGDGNAPPILPAALAVRRPPTAKAADLNTIMVDGSLWQLRRFNSDPTGGGLKSRPIVAAVTDEAAEMKHENALTALQGRCVDMRGRLFLATSPVGGSFLQTKIVERCEEWARMPADHPAKTTGEHVGAQWVSASISLLQNPWLDPEGVRRDIAAQDKDSPSYKRDYLGLWVTGAGPMWRYDDDRHTFLHEARSIVDMLPIASRLAGRPQVRITDKLVHRLFRSRTNPAYKGLRATNDRYILGMDVNGGNRAMNTVIVEVTADAAAPNDRDRWHFWVLDVFQSWHSDALQHARNLASTAWVRRMNPTAEESPYLGCGIIADPQAIFRNPTADRYGGDPRDLVEIYGDRGFDVRAPEYKPGGVEPIARLDRWGSHLAVARLLDEGRLHVSQRCAANLIKSFHRQEVSPDGCTPTKNDHLAGPVDALRYLVHAVLHGHVGSIDSAAAMTRPNALASSWGSGG